MDGIDFNTLWKNFVDTITKHYADFDGRVGRAQFWYFILVYCVAWFVLSIVDSMSVHGGLTFLYMLALLLPSVAMTARRLHDTGRPGAWAWLIAVPTIARFLVFWIWIATIMTLGLGAIFLVFVPFLSLAALAAVVFLIYFCAQPGEPVANEYGPPPPPWSPGPAPTAKA